MHGPDRGVSAGAGSAPGFSLDALARSMRVAFEHADDAQLILDGAGMVMDANRACAVLLGYSREDLAGRRWSDLVLPADREHDRAARRAAAASETGTGQAEIRLVRRDARAIWAVIAIAAAAPGAAVLRIRHALTAGGDASAPQRDALVNLLFDRASTGLALSQPDGALVMVNPAFARFLGSTPTALLGRRTADLLHPDGNREPAASADDERQFLGDDGRVVWGDVTTTIACDPSGAVAYAIEQVQDITARRAAESELLAIETRFQALVEHLPVAVFAHALDADQPPLYMSPQLALITGYSPEDLSRQRDFLLPYVHPEDQPAVAALIAETDDSLGPFDITYRLRHKDSRWIWVHNLAVLVRDADGAPSHWQGVLVDITAEKTAEVQLDASERTFLSTFYRAPVGMWITRPDLRLLDVNPAFCALLGYTRDELLAMGDHVLGKITHPGDMPAYSSYVPRVASDTGADSPVEPDTDINLDLDLDGLRAEKRYIRKDGSIAWGRLSVAAVRGADGRVLRYIGQIEDISGYRRALDALTASEARLRAAVERSHELVVVEDADGIVRWVSPAVSALHGFAPDDIVGIPSNSFVHPDDREIEASHRRALLDRPEQIDRAEFRVRQGDGAWAWVEAIGVNELANPAIGGVVYTIRDITERKHAELAVHQARDLQRQATERLETLNRQRAEFVDLLSREFRSSLSTIQGYGDLLGFEIRGMPDAIDYAAAISESARRLNNLVTGFVRSTSAEEQQQLALLRAPAQLNVLLSAAGSLLRERWPDERVRMGFDLSLPPVFLDSDLVIRAIVALADVALEHSGDAAPIFIRAHGGGDDLQEIVITGPAMRLPDSAATCVFQRRPAAGVDDPVFARAVARAHGGNAWADFPNDGEAALRLTVATGAWPPGKA